MTDDEVKDAAKDGVGLLVSTGLLGAALARASQGISECVVCADCARLGPVEPDLDYRWCEYSNNGMFNNETNPPWPGCRGFRLRDGSKGPEKRYAEKVKADSEAAREKARKVVAP